MATRRVRVHVRGLVQGVYYRLTMQKTAIMHGVSGWVRNVEDGSVEAVIEGDSENVARVIKWCSGGPDEARVDGIDTHDEDPTGEFTSFDIRD